MWSTNPAIVIGSDCGTRLTLDKDGGDEAHGVEVLFRLKLFKSDEMESVEVVEEDEDDPDGEWRVEEDNLLLDRVCKVDFARLHIFVLLYLMGGEAAVAARAVVFDLVIIPI
ncbi:unnamed protein product [Didymodactylos carnosus]|uniref:Uncharacterized protein n=1 Tax=Didymodactylos carnosus TaxID=1234261 RepID=A0A814XW41_9BILA|nr:unnamed protein product [Didymodactylos carnosus]CAF1221047.1 unnamed protein product [Didymodactylos carnosus]CAF3786920.1 unnamed protein product [Didymodactylos carnosus]CAF3984425.1 unnamed protein product [Didymodactylos carnosus]